jgi:hypothetical protein
MLCFLLIKTKCMKILLTVKRDTRSRDNRRFHGPDTRRLRVGFIIRGGGGGSSGGGGGGGGGSVGFDK